VTGGTSGIGLGIAIALAKEGADVVVASRHAQREALDRIQASNGRAWWIKADVSVEAGVERMIAQAERKMGGVDLFVNNAAGTWHEPITRLTRRNWQRTLDTNLTACAIACREVARQMIRRRSGGILIIGSTAAHVPLYSESSYRVSKAGLKALTEVLAIELAPFDIRVNLLTPGGFLTPLTEGLPPKQMGGHYIPLRRLGRVEELANAAVFLLSDQLSSYTTGAELVVDGGFRLRPMDLLSRPQLIALNSQAPPRADRQTAGAR